jgi:hypothetical protein
VGTLATDGDGVGTGVTLAVGAATGVDGAVVELVRLQAVKAIELRPMMENLKYFTLSNR